MAYSRVEDLLLGDLILPRTVSKEQFVQSAADEIEAKLGFIYKTPLAPCVVPEGFPEVDPEFKHLPSHEQKLVASINNRLASGRLIMTLDTAGEQTTLHAYGFRLVKEALDELHMVANGEVDLTACRQDPSNVSGGIDRVPSVLNEDEESLLLGFQNTVLRADPWWSRPGKVT